MALTDFCDVFASFHEDGFNNIVTALQHQRPSLFNYGTQSYVDDPNLLCYIIYPKKIDPEVITHPDPVVQIEPLIKIPGYEGPFGLQYCFQLAELSVDFSPNNIHELPSEIKSLFGDQCLSIKCRVCGAINCPGTDILNRVAAYLPANTPVYHKTEDPASKDSDRNEQPKPVSPLIPMPVNTEGNNCFCIDLFAVCNVRRGGNPADPVVSIHLNSLELVDVKPDGLESSMECFLTSTLILGILPRIKIGLNALVLQIKDFLTIEPTPLSGSVPNNPLVENDQLKVFITLVA